MYIHYIVFLLDLIYVCCSILFINNWTQFKKIVKIKLTQALQTIYTTEHVITIS